MGVSYVYSCRASWSDPPDCPDPTVIKPPCKLMTPPKYLFIAFVIAVVGACSRKPDAANTEAAVVLDAGVRLKVLERDGEAVRVEAPGGQIGYVTADRLQSPPGPPGTAGAGDLELTAPTSLLPQKPSAAVEVPPRSLPEIDRERDRLNALYVSEDGEERQLGPRGNGAYLRLPTGKTLWRAWTCNNAECKAQGDAATPFVFPYVLPIGFRPDGTTFPDGAASPPRCSRCAQTDTVAPYDLPETARRSKQLDEEHRRLVSPATTTPANPAPK